MVRSPHDISLASPATPGRGVWYNKLVPGIDHLKDRALWSESVYLDCVSADGQAAFVVRLCRYPSAETGWLWGHVFLQGRVYAYTDHYLPCSSTVTPVDSPDARYDLGERSPVVMDRAGPRDAPTLATVRVHFQAHAEAHPGHGPGAHHIMLGASFHPLSASGTTVPGRIELLGRVSAVVSVDDIETEFTGFGQWHEQHQEQPRFRRPFTYTTLRGERLSFVATRGPVRAVGYARRGDQVIAIAGYEVGPPAPVRRLRLELADGAVFAGEARMVYSYSVPIYDMRRPGTIVVADIDGERLSGCINDLATSPGD
jgi:hypothetical protein